MEHEFFIATEYNDHGRPYLGFLGNFIDMRERVVYIERVETERDSSVGVDSAKRILPASYKDRVYLALKENLSDFTTTKSDFYAKIKDKEYDMRVYKALKENLTDFDKTPEQFVSLVNE